MFKKISLLNLLVVLMVFGGVNDYLAQADELKALLPDVEGRAGQRISIPLSLSGNSMGAQSGIFILFDPDVVFIADVRRDVSPGSALKGTDFFLIPAVKNNPSQLPANTLALFLGIFPSSFPAPIIPDGEIVTIKFTTKDDVKAGEFTNLTFSLVHNSATSFANQNGMPLSITDSNFTDGRILVIGRSGGTVELFRLHRKKIKSYLDTVFK